VGGINAGFIDTAEAIGELEEGTEEGGAIVLDELDQAGLLDEAAELDQVASAFAPCPDARAHVGAGPEGLQPMALSCGQTQPARRGLKLPTQHRRRR